MKLRFRNIKLGLISLALSVSNIFVASAKEAPADGKQWREVFRMDFGGNSESDPGLCGNVEEQSEELLKNAVSDLSPLNEYLGGQGNKDSYFLIKNTNALVCDEGTAPAINKWVTGSDYTYPDDDTKGYYMAFDVNTKQIKKVFEKTFTISCTGVRFNFSCVMANLADMKNGGAGNSKCKVRLGMYGLGAAGETLLKSKELDLLPSGTEKIKWNDDIDVSFQVPDDATYNTVAFRIEPVGYPGNGYDFALDDIVVAVEQPIMNLKNDTKYNYKQPVNIIADYDLSAFTNFFGSGFSDVKYRWDYSESEDGPWKQIESGSYKSGSNMAYSIDAFEKEKHNGYYRLTVGTSSNMNDDGGFCAIQQTFQINEEKNNCYVTICQDETKTVFGETFKSSDGPTIDKGSIVFYITEYPYKLLEPQIDETCLNSKHPDAGDFPLDTLLTKVQVDATTKCVSEKKPIILRVKEGKSQAPVKDLCEGGAYRGKMYNDADETGKLKIEFDSVECSWEQVILVHPNVESHPEQVVCKGTTFQGKTWNTPGVYDGNPFKVKTVQYGCDSTVIYKIIVNESKEVTLDDVELCQGPDVSYKFGDKTYRDPIDSTLTYTCTGSNGCDSTTTVHLTIYPSGTIGPFDTLICRDQFLFGTEYNVAGDFTVTRKGFTPNGCPSDTIWNVKVVEVQLKLRVAFNQTDVCEGTALELIATLVPSYASYHWEPSIGNNSIRPTIWPTETTTYTVFADLDLPSDVYGDAAGCHASESITINVHPQPTLVIDSVDSDTRNVEYSIASGTPPYNLYMNTKNLGKVEELSGTLENQPYGNHVLMVEDSIGCSAEAKFSVEAKPLEPDEYFSPNGDGENDIWRIGNIDVYPNAIVRVYDRLGRVIYYSKGYENENGFDGTYNGNPLPSTDYWYEIDVEELDKQYVGHFTLLR